MPSLQELCTIVQTIKHHIRSYLPQLVGLIRTYWSDQNLLPHLITLIEQLSLAIQAAVSTLVLAVFL